MDFVAAEHVTMGFFWLLDIIYTVHIAFVNVLRPNKALLSCFMLFKSSPALNTIAQGMRMALKAEIIANHDPGKLAMDIAMILVTVRLGISSRFAMSLWLYLSPKKCAPARTAALLGVSISFHFGAGGGFLRGRRGIVTYFRRQRSLYCQCDND